MPAVTTSELFPSVAFIATNAKGDLQEVVGVDEQKANLVYSGLTFEAAAAGVGGNDYKVEILGDAVIGAAQAAFDSALKKVTIKVPTAAAVAASVTAEGLTFTAAAAGAAGNNIRVRYRQNQSGVTGVEVSRSGNDITIDSENAAAATTQSDIKTAFDAQSFTDITIAVSNGSANMANPFTTYQSLASGADAVTIADATQGDVKTAFDAAAITDITLAVADAGANLSGGLAESSLINGLDAVSSQLEGSAKYMLIKEADLYDFDEATEATDGRKVLWGILHNASEVWAGKTAQPESLKIARSAISSTDGGTALKQTYTITTKYAIGGLDLKPE